MASQPNIAIRVVEKFIIWLGIYSVVLLDLISHTTSPFQDSGTYLASLMSIYACDFAGSSSLSIDCSIYQQMYHVARMYWWHSRTVR